MAAVALSAAAPPVRDYALFYATESNNPFCSDYIVVLGNYTLPTAITDEQLSLSINDRSSQQLPTAFIILSRNSAEGLAMVRCYHRVAPFRPRFLMPATEWNGRISAFKGELVSGKIATVEWTRNWVSQGNGTNITSTITINTRTIVPTQR